MSTRKRKGSAAASAKAKKAQAPQDDAFEKVRQGEIVLENTERMMHLLGFADVEKIPSYYDALKTIFVHGNESYIRPFMRGQKRAQSENENEHEKEGEQEKEKDVAEVCFVFVAPHTKLRIDSVRDYTAYIEEYRKAQADTSPVDKIWAIVLSSESPSTVAVNQIVQQSLPLRVLSFSDMGQLAVDHSLAPKVRQLTPEETTVLLRDLGITSTDTMKKMETSDSLCKLYGFAVGTVLRLQLPAKPPYYRVVVHPH